ncbi:MAG: DEAD/DEAH box helicase, partial [Gammaproteobacteria bacterium]
TRTCLKKTALKRTRARRQAEQAVQRESERIIREARLAQLTFSDSDLPVASRFDEIRDLLAKHAVIVVAGETGSGKSTLLPQMMLKLGYGARGRIGHTQPRRLAATALTHTLNEQVHSPAGSVAGYQIRFHTSLAPEHLIKVMTDGVLLTEIQHDPWLNAYDVLIIDEAHERSTNIDLLLGYVKRVLEKRNDLKVIVTSATLDHELSRSHCVGAE